MPDQKPGQEMPGSFAAFFADTRRKTDAELFDEMTKLVAAVEDTGKAGKLVLTVEFKPVNGGGSAILVNDSISVKKPERDREGSIAYIDVDHTLSRRDPSAMPLFDYDIREAPTHDPQTGEVKEVPET